MIAWIFDHTPLWVWLLAGGAGLAASYTIWLPIWGLLPKPAQAALIALAAVIGAYLAGRNRGAANEQQRQKEQNAKAIQTRTEIDHEVRNLPDADLKRRGAKWLRD